MRKIKHLNPGKCFVCGCEAVWKTHRVKEKNRRACEAHKPEVEAWEKLNKRSPDDGYMTEADYQTWGRL